MSFREYLSESTNDFKLPKHGSDPAIVYGTHTSGTAFITYHKVGDVAKIGVVNMKRSDLDNLSSTGKKKDISALIKNAQKMGSKFDAKELKKFTDFVANFGTNGWSASERSNHDDAS